MNFTAVRGFNAYAQFSAVVRETVKLQKSLQEHDIKQEQTSYSIDDPVDVLTISHSAKRLSLSLVTERDCAQTTLKEWMRESGSMGGAVTHRVSGQTMQNLLSSSGITFEDGESYNINMDVWCAVTVTGKNTEKAKAIQQLLNSTPGGINWGVLLQKLPPR